MYAMFLETSQSAPAGIPPWVSLTVAVMALLGVIITAIVLHSNAQLHERHEAQLAELRRDHEVRLEALKNEFDEKKVRELLNEEQWKRIVDQMWNLSKQAAETFEHFKRLAIQGHEMDDDAAFNIVVNALLAHEQFRILLGELRGRINDQHHATLSQIHRFFVVVFLDVARTKAERIGKATVMENHNTSIQKNYSDFREVMAYYISSKPFHAENPAASAAST
jgi:hypothetical protein